jgi:hypothetical protein
MIEVSTEYIVNIGNTGKKDNVKRRSNYRYCKASGLDRNVAMVMISSWKVIEN